MGEIMRIRKALPIVTFDVFPHRTLTHWACGCPLRCPFCHNWAIAEMREECIEVDGARLARGLMLYAYTHGIEKDIEYVQITGGEPLLTPRNASDLVEASRHLPWPLSINSSLVVSSTIVEVALDAANHFAFDVKVPFEEMTGIHGKAAETLWKNFTANVRRVVDAGKQTEARIPVSKFTEPEKVVEALREIDRRFDIVIVQPLVNEGQGVPVHPRNPKWSGYKGRIERDEAEEWRRVLSPFARKVVIRNFFLVR